MGVYSPLSASLVPHPSPQRLRFGWPLADIARFTNSSTYLLTYYLLLPAQGLETPFLEGCYNFGVVHATATNHFRGLRLENVLRI